MDFTDVSFEDLDAQIAEMEGWLIGCRNALCVCCNSDALDPDLHADICPYKIAAEQEAQ